MNLAKKLRKIAEGYPSRRERNIRKCVKQRVRSMTKEVLAWCRKLAIDGKMSYNWNYFLYDNDEIISKVMDCLKKKGFTTTLIREDGEHYYVHILWEK